MIVAVKNGPSLTLTQGKKRNGKWVCGNKYVNRCVADTDVIQISALTENQKIRIVEEHRARKEEQMELSFAKDPSLKELREQWLADIERTTFEDVLRSAEEYALSAEL